jgi:hypothetical protein
MRKSELNKEEGMSQIATQTLYLYTFSDLTTDINRLTLSMLVFIKIIFVLHFGSVYFTLQYWKDTNSSRL